MRVGKNSLVSKGTCYNPKTYYVVLLASTLMMLLFGSLIDQAQAANWYVRPNGGSYGSENGTDWNNAFDGFNGISWGSVSCGDTVWVAGGTYTQTFTPAKVCTSGGRLSINRARSDASECTGSAGWSSSFDSTVEQYRTNISMNGSNISYVTISGRTTASGGDYGWVVNYCGLTTGNGIQFIDGYTYHYNTFEYLELKGPGCTSAINFTGADSRGIDLTAYNVGVPSSDGNTFSHIKAYGWATAYYCAWADYTTFEYMDTFDISPINSATYHPNGIYITGSDHGTVRYSKWHKGNYGGTGEGIFFAMYDAKDDWKIYGNTFYDLDYVGVKGIHVRDTVTMTNLKIFNNTFVNNIASMYIQGVCSTGCETRNNLFYPSGGGTCGTVSNNLTTAVNPFVNLGGKDFRIVSTTGSNYPRNLGTPMSTYFTVDMDGTLFGEDGAWDIGAYENSLGGGSSLIPNFPTALSIN